MFYERSTDRQNAQDLAHVDPPIYLPWRTSLHLNLLHKDVLIRISLDETTVGRMSPKLKWTLLALFAPECRFYGLALVCIAALEDTVNNCLGVRLLIPEQPDTHAYDPSQRMTTARL